MQKKYRLTKVEYKILEEELERQNNLGKKYLKHRSTNIAEGDPRENSGYLLSEALMNENQETRMELEEILGNCEIIELKDDKIVEQGKKVVLSIDGVEKEYVICSTLLANPLEGFISVESPWGKCLLGLRVGDSKSIKMGTEDKKIKIFDVKIYK